MNLTKEMLIITFSILFSTFVYADFEINPTKKSCIFSLDKNDTLKEFSKIMETAIPSRDYDLLKKIKWKYANSDTSFIARAYDSNNTHVIEVHRNIVKIFCGITSDLVAFYTMQSLDETNKKIAGISADSDENMLGLNFNNQLNIPVQTFLLKSGWKKCLNSNFSNKDCQVFSKETIKQFLDKKDYLQYEEMLKDEYVKTSNIILSSIVFVLLHEFAHHALGHTQNITEDSLSIQDIRKKEYEADSYARISLHRGDNLVNISTAFSFDLFSVLDFIPTSTIKKMNYTNKLTHDSAECRGNKIIIDSFKSDTINSIFSNMTSLLNQKYIEKKELKALETKIFKDTGNSLRYLHFLSENLKENNCSYSEESNTTKTLNEYAKLISMTSNIMNLAYQKNYKKIIEVLENNITKNKESDDFMHFTLVQNSVNIVNGFYRLPNQDIQAKISSNIVDEFFLKIYNEMGNLDILTTSRILDSLLEYIIMSDKTFNEKIILIEKYAKRAVKYNPELTQSYSYLAELEIHKRNRDKALKYYKLSYETAELKSMKNMIKNFILELEDTSKRLRENTVLKYMHDNSIINKNNNEKENNNSIQLLIPNETQRKFPKLVQMIINSKSFDNSERNYWFNAIPMMKKVELVELVDILETEKVKLDEAYLKYSIISSPNNIKYIFDKVKNEGSINDDMMEKLLDRITFINRSKFTDSLYKKFIKKFESIKNRVKSKDKYYHLLAKFYLQIGKYDRSLNRAEKSIKINSKNYRVYYDIGKAYYGKKDYDNSIIFYKKAVNLNSKDANLYNELGLSYWEIQQYDQSLYFYKKAVKINPENSEFYYNIGRIYSDITKKYKEAIKVLRQALQINPKNTNTISLLANTYSRMKEYNKALTLCQDALKINPKNSYTYSVLSNIYLSKKDYKKAMEIYRKFFKITPDKISIYTNFFELQLIQKLSFEKKMEKKYISIFKDKKEKFIHYEMLKILENITFKYEINLEEWQEKYKDTKSNWNFDILDKWAENIQDKDIQKKILDALTIFKE